MKKPAHQLCLGNLSNFITLGHKVNLKIKKNNSKLPKHPKTDSSQAILEKMRSNYVILTTGNDIMASFTKGRTDHLLRASCRRSGGEEG